jgi:hypothetical protein
MMNPRVAVRMETGPPVNSMPVEGKSFMKSINLTKNINF